MSNEQKTESDKLRDEIEHLVGPTMNDFSLLIMNKVDQLIIQVKLEETRKFKKLMEWEEN